MEGKKSFNTYDLRKEGGDSKVYFLSKREILAISGNGRTEIK